LAFFAVAHHRDLRHIGDEAAFRSATGRCDGDAKIGGKSWRDEPMAVFGGADDGMDRSFQKISVFIYKK
jgi:hypothetical protein